MAAPTLEARAHSGPTYTTLLDSTVASPYGYKARFLVERGVTRSQMERWRKQVFAGTLELGLVPRVGGVVSVEEAESLKRLLAENQALKEQLADKDDELAVQRRAVDALGKAIESLQRSGGSKSSSQDAAPSRAPEPPRD